MTTGACAGVRVLELSGGRAGGLAAMVLADFGAEVVRVAPADGPVEEPRRVMLDRGKRIVRADLATTDGWALVRELAADVDVVIDDLGAGRAAAGGVTYDALSVIDPSVIWCSITGWGPTGPLAGAPADDGLVMARAGVFRDQLGWLHDGRRRPVFRSARDASYAAGMLAVQGVTAALLARETTGRGQLVETSLLQALTCRLNPMVRWFLPEGADPPLGNGYTEEPPAPADPEARLLAEITGMLALCKDGRWIVHMNFERNFFPSWVHVLGLDWIWDEERFAGAPHRFADPSARGELALIIYERMQEKTAAEWMELYVADGNVCADIVETTAEALQHPQVVAGDYLVEVDDPDVGRVVQIGPLAKVSGAPGVVRPREHVDATRWDDGWKRFAPSSAGELTRGPLDGLTIVEVASHYATPAASALLTDLGARVVKVEPINGDAYRRAVRGMGHDNLIRALQGKEDIAVDMKDPRGQEIVHRLVARADVLLHNFRLGVPERLAIDYETLRAINPRLVYQYGASYGSTGPYRRQPAIDHVIAAFAGTSAYQTGEGNPPLKEQGADPAAAAGTAAAMLLGLLARHRTGESQYVESAMIVSNLFLNLEDAYEHAGKEPRPTVDHDQFGTGATYRLYETAPVDASYRTEPYENPDPRWVFLSAEDDDAFARFCEVAGRAELITDSRCATADARRANRVEVEHLLQEAFRARTAPEWERVLLENGVGCVVADAMSQFAFMYEHPQARALGVMVPAEHVSLGGRYRRHAPAVRFSDTPGVVGNYCDIGEHTREVLTELGYGGGEIDELRAAGVITWPEGPVQVFVD